MMESMDSLLRDVLAETPEGDRGKLISFCLETIPDEMNFIDSVVFMAALTDMKLLDIDNVSIDLHTSSKTQDDYSKESGYVEFPKIIQNTIFNLGGLKCDYVDGIGDYGDYDADTEYALRINHARRRSTIVEGGSTSATLPLSMWPTVLERAYEHSYQIYDHEKGIYGCSKQDVDTFRSENKNLNGLYYLLRNGLVGLHDFSLNGRGSSDN
jgi:hypothetical protein